MKLAKPYKGLRGSADLYAGYEIDEERESIAQELENIHLDTFACWSLPPERRMEIERKVLERIEKLVRELRGSGASTENKGEERKE